MQQSWAPAQAVGENAARGTKSPQTRTARSGQTVCRATGKQKTIFQNRSNDAGISMKTKGGGEELAGEARISLKTKAFT